MKKADLLQASDDRLPHPFQFKHLLLFRGSEAHAQALLMMVMETDSG